MKKAQWKQDPRQRAFGKDPRDALIDTLTDRLKIAETQISTLRATDDARVQRIKDLNAYDRHKHAQVNAYQFLRNAGVVMEHNGEFKHLQGKDMDAFFNIKEHLHGNNYSHIAMDYAAQTAMSMRSLKADVLATLTNAFTQEYEKYTVTGNGKGETWR